MFFIVWILISISFFSIFLQWRYLKKQKKQCKKYPFYKLRDKVIMEIITSNNPNNYIDLYEYTNWVIEKLKKFNFIFYSDVVIKVFHNILEEAYKNNWKIDDELINRLKNENQSGPLFREFIELILDTAKANSLLLKLSMTKLGYRIFFTTHVFKAASMFIKEHPEYTTKKRSQKKVPTKSKFFVIRDYVFLNKIAPVL